MKKYLFGALALPLLFACSSEDFTEKEVVGNNQFAGIEKVDATFSMDEGAMTRMDNGSWNTQEGDLWGFAWMGDGSVITGDGKAYQNHNLIQTSGIFTPQTSIYVGKYYIYRPYDKETVSPQAINFKSLEEQPLADGYESAKEPWKELAKTAINIGDKWTNVTVSGTTDAEGNTWDKAGIKEHYKINAAMFSNQTGLDLTYEHNNEVFDGKTIAGATDINYTYPEGSKIGAADIYDGTVQLDGAAKSFTYAPTSEPNSGTHSGTYWANKKNLGTTEGFNFTSGAITLKAADENGVSTDKEDNKGWFWFNSLPVTAGDATLTTNVTTVLNTSYGQVTVTEPLANCAYVLDKYNTSSTDPEWIQLVAGTTDDATTSPKKWGFDSHNTFINQYGNHKGKYALTVDFSKGVMTNMHIKNDAHLQKALKYYIASGKTETVNLNLDKDADGVFKISKLSIALLQTINASTTKVTVRACTTPADKPSKIIITQDGQAAIGLADKKEVPALNRVFTVNTDVYLSKDCEWTWAGGADGKTALATGSNVKTITNEGTLTVTATNIEMGGTTTLTNAAGATMNITKVTTVKDVLTNLGTINVGSAENKAAELRAYDIEIKNDATSLTAKGVINNYGVVGVSETGGTTGKFNNYGLIDMKNGEAITLLTSNELGTDPFGTAFNASTNKMGTVVLPENNPTAIVSVSNAAENGFIEYNWTGATYATPAGIVKYNTIVVSNNIAFTANAPEVQYIKFNGTRTQVVNPADDNKLTELKGIIVNAGKSIIVEKNNVIDFKVGAYLGAGATIYKGGAIKLNGSETISSVTSNYFGTWELSQIVKW